MKQRFIVTYLQECTQPVDADTIEGAANFAKRYATANKLKLLSVYPEQQPAPVDAEPRAA